MDIPLNGVERSRGKFKRGGDQIFSPTLSQSRGTGDPRRKILLDWSPRWNIKGR